MKQVTLDDLSSHLNLSKFSVSRALSGKGGVSERTREQVFDAARELGYDHPAIDVSGSPAGRRLVLVIPWEDAISSPFWMEIVAGAEAEAKRMGYQLTEHLIKDEGDARALPRGVRGLILAGRRSRGLLESYLELGNRVVLIGHTKPLEPIDSVLASSWASGYLIGRYLGTLGHRHVAYVTDVPEDVGRQERFRGLCEALQDFAGATASSHTHQPDTDALGVLRESFRGPELPTAIFGATDRVALTMAWALSEAGLKVPQHVSVAGCHDSDIATQIGVRLTTVHSPMRQVGAAAVQMMDWRLEHAASDEAVRKLSLQPTLVERESTGPANPEELRNGALLAGLLQPA
ncbi:MAG TPA: LacI family DNA-binding transcriptional regulator [Arsenicitalea sp.]|jgi:LacI family transcriptional regulator|nr:LacI family DNA-binding transcriptional regulator [Arsenicitalea sp.]